MKCVSRAIFNQAASHCDASTREEPKEKRCSDASTPQWCIIVEPFGPKLKAKRSSVHVEEKEGAVGQVKRIVRQFDKISL